MKALELVHRAAETARTARAAVTPGATVAPGQRAVIDDRLAEGDCVAQGDLMLEVAGRGNRPAGLAAAPETGARLVPGTEDGARHYLVPVSGTVLVGDLPDDPDSLVGPIIYVGPGSRAVVDHRGAGRHGPVHLEGGKFGLLIQVRYQRTWMAAERAARRARD